ncbi:hypothetical protein HanIR_Chr17g0862181 [Helianthus annuus]|nr:hypothetical protein HanIR_Chr17g0862181 [Helianthus annuus]
MGNCQAVDAAALVIQHPSGKIERMYWSVTVSQVMKMNPGHYVSLIIPLPGTENDQDGSGIKPFGLHELSCFGQVTLLFLAALIVLSPLMVKVMKVLKAKRQAKKKKENHSEDEKTSRLENTSQVMTHERTIKQRSGSFSRSKSWRPALQSISEAASAS